MNTYIVDHGIAQESARGRSLRAAATRYWKTYLERYGPSGLPDLEEAQIVDHDGNWYKLVDVVFGAKPLVPTTYTAATFHLPTGHPEDATLDTIRTEFNLGPPPSKN